MKKFSVSLIALTLVLVGCKSGPADEKQAFIDATVEATCMIFQSDNIFDPALEDAAKEIYDKHGFDASDDEAMAALTKKYENDEDVQQAITDALEKCAGDFLGELDGALDGSSSEEAAVSEEAEVTEPAAEATSEETTQEPTAEAVPAE